MKSFAERAKEVLGFELNSHQLRCCQIYSTMLIEWNKRMNLTAITDPEQIENKHFLDSFSIIPLIRDIRQGEVVDVGTGAGFPGIPIKIILPEMKVTLIDSIGKKAIFCREVIRKIDLKGIQVVQGRAEELGQSSAFRERYNVGIARAVAQLDVLAEYLLPLIQLGGRMIAQKGGTGPEEVQKAESAIRILGGALHTLVPITINGISEERYIIVVRKVAPTPKKYPRQVGVPTRKKIQ
jgi:16S rRNA (guanine527-N7)-methyltransferase